MPAFQNALKSRHCLFLSVQISHDYECSYSRLTICMCFGLGRLSTDT